LGHTSNEAKSGIKILAIQAGFQLDYIEQKLEDHNTFTLWLSTQTGQLVEPKLYLRQQGLETYPSSDNFKCEMA
jgi:hypothetical protein